MVQISQIVYAYHVISGIYQYLPIHRSRLPGKDGLDLVDLLCEFRNLPVSVHTDPHVGNMI